MNEKKEHQGKEHKHVHLNVQKTTPEPYGIEICLVYILVIQGIKQNEIKKET